MINYTVISQRNKDFLESETADKIIITFAYWQHWQSYVAYKYKILLKYFAVQRNHNVRMSLHGME
jgi:hypothetical protein